MIRYIYLLYYIPIASDKSSVAEDMLSVAKALYPPKNQYPPLPPDILHISYCNIIYANVSQIQDNQGILQYEMCEMSRGGVRVCGVVVLLLMPLKFAKKQKRLDAQVALCLNIIANDQNV